MIFKEIKAWFLSTDIVEKILAINILIYLISSLFHLNFLRLDFALSAHWNDISRRFWSVFTYSFVHIRMPHLLFNCLFLWAVGHAFLQSFNQVTFIKFYLTGTLGAALIYLSGMLLLGQTHSYLYGSSAATMSLFFALVSYQPERAFFIPVLGQIFLKHIALFFFGIDFFLLFTGSNTGGHLSHIGGAMVGFFYMKFFELGNDPFNNLWHFFKRKVNLKFYQFGNSSQKIDRILEKISRSGYDSLSLKEKKILFHSGKKPL